MSAIRGTVLHATALAVAVDPDGPLAGLLIQGASGAGKSDLALRLIETCPFARTSLVSDDGVLVAPRSGAVIATCPEPARIGGLLEIRGVGICPVRSVDEVRLALVVSLGGEADRIPNYDTASLPGTGGLDLPCLSIDPWQLSAPHKVRYGLRSILTGDGPAGRRER